MDSEREGLRQFTRDYRLWMDNLDIALLTTEDRELAVHVGVELNLGRMACYHIERLLGEQEPAKQEPISTGEPR